MSYRGNQYCIANCLAACDIRGTSQISIQYDVSNPNSNNVNAYIQTYCLSRQINCGIWSDKKLGNNWYACVIPDPSSPLVKNIQVYMNEHSNPHADNKCAADLVVDLAKLNSNDISNLTFKALITYSYADCYGRVLKITKCVNISTTRTEVTCFSENVSIQLPIPNKTSYPDQGTQRDQRDQRVHEAYDLMTFGELKEKYGNDSFDVITLFGIRQAKLIEHKNYSGTMIDMGEEKLVTLDHMIKIDDTWKPADYVFSSEKYDRVIVKNISVFNLHLIASDITMSNDEKHYILYNNYIAHNKLPA